ncbi:unnamed protein product (macronuclear) [Paramecium tetraurelia]|uniref:1-phosphatidylinositol 4-kinase n=1 Tax=Paramecium tetraurelia TaxID=5888 RepID=A0BJY8_PARTE|nr:uncharacterized protein GSPATT00029485001 [Paramecium tetraurelia]CAK58855.1 unnamed protein product [Paramecium tetraurelia]|eukprot:XP_001426253.1 hypothetical protein (macronuclear) [Paramecium tetraurelia strain d4-2]
MFITELRDVYQYMQSQYFVLNKETILSIRTLQDKYFDQKLLELLLQSEDIVRKDVLEQFQSTLQQLQECQLGGNTFIRNVRTMVKVVTHSIAMQMQSNVDSYGSINQILNISEINGQQIASQSLIELCNKYVAKFIHLRVQGTNENIQNNNSIIIENVAKSVHYKLLDPAICQTFMDNIENIKEKDEETFNNSSNLEQIYTQIKSTYSLIMIINSITINNQIKLEQLHYISKISTSPIFLQFIIKLLKQQRDEFGGWQLDLIQKNKVQSFIKEMFEVVANNLHKASIPQIYEFCQGLKYFKYLGFDVLYSINFYFIMHELHYNFGSFLSKVLIQKQQLQQIIDHQLLQELFLIEQKLNYILKSIQHVFVQSFYHEENQNKVMNERKIHQIVQLWNSFFENRTEFVQQDYFKQMSQLIKLNYNSNAKEEQLLRRISFLRLANTFLLRDKQQEVSFSSNAIIDLVQPKLNLYQIIQQVLLQQNKQDKPNIMVMQYMIKRLYQFYLNLLANLKDKQFREKALKELSKSIQLFFDGDDLFSQSKIQQNVLDYIADKIYTNYFLCDTQEQVQFFIEIMTVVNQQLLKIEEEFLTQVEQCKGTQEGMRSLSLFRQLVQKAQGQNYQNLSIGSILEKKVIDYKRVFQIIPLLSKCSQIFNDSSQVIAQRLKAQQLISEFWIYITLNNPSFFLSKKDGQKEQLTNEEGKLLNEQIQPLRELYKTMWLPLNLIAFQTPNLLAGSKTSLLDLKIIMKLVENKDTFTYNFFYFNSLARQMKILFRIKKKELKDKHLEPQDLVYIVTLNDILQRCQANIIQDIKQLQKQQYSYIMKLFNFLKQTNDEEELLQNKEINGIKLTHQQLRNQLNKQVKFQSLLKESITRAAVQYNSFLLNSKGTLTKEIICKDFVYLLQQSCSIEKTLSEYASDMVIDFIRNFPFVCFSPEVIKVCSYLLTVISQKIGREYDSKSKQVFNDQKVMLNTDQKILTQNIVFLMNCMLKLIFRGLYIDHNFVKVFCLHLIRQETSLLSELPFGYKFLKFLVNSFKVDKEAIETFKDQADRYNPYFWLVKEVEFDTRISSSDMSMFLSDKGLLRLQKINIEQRIPYASAQEILKLINYSIKNEIEFDFHAEDLLQINYVQVLKDIQKCCQELNIIHFIYNNKSQVASKLKGRMQQLRINVRESNYKKAKQEIVREMLQHVTQLKSVIIHSGAQIKTQILTKLLDICKFYLQPQLLKYILMRLIPFLHSISQNYFDSTFFFLLGEMLHYIIYQINNLGNLKYDKKISSQDIFQIKINYFNQLQDLEAEEFTDFYLNKLEEPYINFINLAQIGYYEIRWQCLCKLHLILIRFLNDNMQIHLVKNVKLSIIANILKHNFMTDRKLVEFIPLENVCQVLKGSIEIIQLMKEFKEKFKDTQDYEVKIGQNNQLHSMLMQQNLAVKFNIESFYYKTLKFGLSHFAKNINLYHEPLFIQCQNQSRLIKRYQLYCIVCKYLAKDKLNELNEDSKIPKMKRVKKRFNSVIFKSHRQIKMTTNPKEGQARASILMQGNTSQIYRKLQAEIAYNGQQTYAISLQKLQEQRPLEVRPYYLRKALYFLLCDEIDKIKAFASRLQDELQTDYSLMTQNKLSDNFIQQILNEIPDKNLNLAYYILKKLYPIMQTELQLNDVLYKFLGHKISSNIQNYYDCSHFFDIIVTHNMSQIENYTKILLYWKPPHIQLLLKYITDQFENYPDVQLCFSKIMKRLHSEQIIFYLSQILQSLASKSGQLIKTFLIEYAQQSVLFAHQLLWLARVESKIDVDHKRPPSPKNKGQHQNILRTPEYQQFVRDLLNQGRIQRKQYQISKVAPFIISKIIRNMDSEQTSFFKKVDTFYESVTAISGQLRPQMSKPEKRDIIAKKLREIVLTQDIYMPTNPRYQITSIKLDSGTPMQSAAKCPILVSFLCRKYEGPDKYFERKLKEKREFGKALEIELTKQLKEEDIQKMLIIFEQDPLPDDEEKGQLFINELVRPLRSNGQIQIMSQSMQSNYKDSRIHKQSQSFEKHSFKQPTPRGSLKKQTTNYNNADQQQEIKSCIFKVFDDIRQDNLALQIISMFKGVFERCGLDLHVFPYKTISNRTGKSLNVGGIIEVVPNTISRDQLGKTNRCTLYEYFINKFGAEDSLQFQIARENFIKSQAAYSIISYILQIKDRHNGNILISDKGHLIHIDFGFIFDISPGGNLKFESANFKLTKEMSQIMGGEVSNNMLSYQAFNYYVDLTVRAFLAIRHYYEHFYYLVTLMTNSGLGCFMKDSMKNFTERFQLKKNDLAAAKYMQSIIEDANDKITTRWYDNIQYYQNGISR